jgi:hypothetical protein
MRDPRRRPYRVAMRLLNHARSASFPERAIQQSITPLPTDAFAQRAAHSERPLRRFQIHTRSNISQPEIAGSRASVSLHRYAAKRQCAQPHVQFERRDGLQPPDCPQLCTQKSQRDRQVLRWRCGRLWSTRLVPLCLVGRAESQRGGYVIASCSNGSVSRPTRHLEFPGEYTYHQHIGSRQLDRLHV